MKKILRDKRFTAGFFVLILWGVLLIFAPIISPLQSYDLDLSLRMQSPSWEHFLGCDKNGGDVLTSILFGGRLCLMIAFLSVAISSAIGTVIGILCGYYRGKIDYFFMRVVDILMAFPGILLAIALTAVMGPSFYNIIFAISLTGWTSYSRLIRAQVMSLTEREYVIGAKALGAFDFRIIRKHIFPGLISPLMIQATFSIAGVILVESSLSFLGLGPQENILTWGALLSDGRTVIEEAPHLSIFPGVAIMSIVLSLNFLGDALRDFLDPKEV